MDEDLLIIRRADGDHVPKRAAWERVLQAWQHSGLRASAFARQHGIPTKRFFRWQAKLLPREKAQVAADFVELALATPSAPAAGHSGDAPLEVHLGQARILVREGCKVDLLRMLLSVVGEGAC